MVGKPTETADLNLWELRNSKSIARKFAWVSEPIAGKSAWDQLRSLPVSNSCVASSVHGVPSSETKICP